MNKYHFFFYQFLHILKNLIYVLLMKLLFLKILIENYLIYYHITTTHTNFEIHNNILDNSNNCFNFSFFTNKLERKLEPAINFICDTKSEIKQVILYYPFINKITKKKYLFVKLESYPMNTFRHLINFIFQPHIRNNNISEHRVENDNLLYKFKNIDETFYKNIGLKNDLEEYNTNIRKGNEFYISNQLLEYFFKNFII